MSNQATDRFKQAYARCIVKSAVHHKNVIGPWRMTAFYQQRMGPRKLARSVYKEDIRLLRRGVRQTRVSTTG